MEVPSFGSLLISGVISHGDSLVVLFDSAKALVIRVKTM
jgi:hypothetical protein